MTATVQVFKRHMMESLQIEIYKQSAGSPPPLFFRVKWDAVDYLNTVKPVICALDLELNLLNWTSVCWCLFKHFSGII